MPQTKESRLRLSSFILVFFFACSFVVLTETNTHQTIKKKSPPVFNVDLKKHDVIGIMVFNTTANVSIELRAESKNFSQVERKFVFAGDNATMNYVSEWDAKAWVIIEVKAYEFSYEITINGKVWRKEENLVSDFFDGNFEYQKTLQIKKYELIVLYQSKKVDRIYMNFNNEDSAVYANQVNKITVEVQSQHSIYDINFYSDADSFESISDFLFEIIIQLPNEMLNGCDGTNVYDSRIRACPPQRQTFMILLGVIGGIIILILLIFFIRKIKAKVVVNDTEGKELVEENQSNSVKVQYASGSTQSNIQNPNMITTENDN